MRTGNHEPDFQPTPQVPISRTIRDKRFTFTKSNKALPIQHFASEFSSIIETKKIYQSMVKEELRKLEILDSHVMDPEIEPFKVSTDAFPAKNSIVGQKQSKIKQIIHEAATKKQWRENQDDWPFDKQVCKQLEMLYLKQECKKFYSRMKSGYKINKLNKAASYFNYIRMCKIYFAKIKDLFAPSKSSPDCTESQMRLCLFLKKTNLLTLRTIIDSFKLKGRAQNFIKSLELRIKTTKLSNMRVIVNNKKQMQAKQLKLTIFVIKNSISSFLIVCRLRKQCAFNQQRLMNVRKLRSFRKIRQGTAKISYANIKNIDSISTMIVDEPAHESIDDRRIHQLCTAANINDPNQVRQVVLASKQKIVRSALATRRQNQSRIEFIRYIAISHNVHQSSVKISTLKIQSFFRKFRLHYYISSHSKQLRSTVLANRTRSLLQHCEFNVRYSKSISNCLKGSKEWLKKNRRIYETQSSTVAIPDDTGHLQFIPVLVHPLSRSNRLQLLKEETKFRNIELHHYGKLVMSQLRDSLRRSKRARMATEVMCVLRKTRTLRLAWDVLKNKQLIQQISQQIGEQLQILQDEQAMNLEEKAALCFIKNTQLSFFSRLKNNHQFLSRQKQLVQFAASKMRGCVLKKIKQHLNKQKLKEQAKQKFTAVGKFIMQRSFKMLCEQLKRNHQIESKYHAHCQELQLHQISIHQKQKQTPIVDLAKTVSHRAYLGQIRVFIQKLKTNFNINHKSIQVTCLYLKTALHRHQKFCSHSRTATKIKQRGYALKQLRANKSIRNCYRVLVENAKNIRDQKLKKNTLLFLKVSLAFKTVIKNLFRHSIDCKQRQEMNICITNLQVKMKQKDIRLFLRRFSNKKDEKNRQIETNPSKRQQNKAAIQQCDQQCPIKLQQPYFNGEQMSKQDVRLSLSEQTTQRQKSNAECLSPNDCQQLVEEELSQEEYRSSIIKQAKKHQSETIIIAFSNSRDGNVNLIRSSDSLQILDHDKIADRNLRPNAQKGRDEQKKSAQNQSVNQLREDPKEHKNVANQSMDSEVQYAEYIQKRFEDNLMKRYFRNWENFKNEKAELKQEYKQIQRKAFESLRMMAWQKKLVRFYLRELDQQTHYYPESKQEYYEFVQLSKQF